MAASQQSESFILHEKMNSLEKIANEEHFGDNNLEAIEDIPEANQFLSPEPES